MNQQTQKLTIELKADFLPADDEVAKLVERAISHWFNGAYGNGEFMVWRGNQSGYDYEEKNGGMYDFLDLKVKAELVESFRVS